MFLLLFLLATSKDDSTRYLTFKGKHKWLGGAVNPVDGSIFGIPSNADSVIRIFNNGNDEDHVNVERIKLPESMRVGRYKWLRGIIAHDHLYGIPAWSNAGVLKVPIVSSSSSRDCDATSVHVGTPTVLPLPNTKMVEGDLNVQGKENSLNDEQEMIRKDRWMWHGAALSEDETYIYCIPSNADRVMKVKVDPNVDPSGPHTEEIGPSVLGKNKWYGGIRGFDGCIYGAPYTARSILRIDPKTDKVTMLGDFGKLLICCI